jgi:2-amino-4-hydroxy-6-hydroxymethyldihydropteridine diphosphokinase
MKRELITAYIGIGSNIGDRESNLKFAVEMLQEQDGVEVTVVSSYLNTAPVGYIDQPDFLNAVVEIRTSLTPISLLEVCQVIEQELKRVRTIRWGPRTIDLDILLYGDMVINEENLIIPHPRMHEREFVLYPLNEIAPNTVHPIIKKSIAELLNLVKN